MVFDGRQGKTQARDAECTVRLRHATGDKPAVRGEAKKQLSAGYFKSWYALKSPNRNSQFISISSESRPARPLALPRMESSSPTQQ